MNKVSFKRIPIIDNFVKKNKRLPINKEIVTMFGGSIGQKTKNILDRYKKSKEICLACNRKLKL